MTADDQDDNHKAKALAPDGQGGTTTVNPADDYDYDRTHLTRLGEAVKVRYPETGSNYEQAIATSKIEKKVRVNIVRFDGSLISK